MLPSTEKAKAEWPWSCEPGMEVVADLDEVEPRPLGLDGLADEFLGAEVLGEELETDLHVVSVPRHTPRESGVTPIRHTTGAKLASQPVRCRRAPPR